MFLVFEGYGVSTSASITNLRRAKNMENGRTEEKTGAEDQAKAFSAHSEKNLNC